LNYPPIVEALDAARTATFTMDEWDGYIRAGMAIQNERGMLSLAKKEGLGEGREAGLKEGLKKGLKDGLQQAIRDLCDVLGIDATADRLEELEHLDVAALSALPDRIKSAKTGRNIRQVDEKLRVWGQDASDYRVGCEINRSTVSQTLGIRFLLSRDQTPNFYLHARTRIVLGARKDPPDQEVTRAHKLRSFSLTSRLFREGH
jgi:hypothetical protein